MPPFITRRPGPAPLFLLLLLAAGCGGGGIPGIGPRPVTPEQMAVLEEHRLRGIALSENRQFVEAAEEFGALAKAAPDLGLGHVNLAHSLLNLPGRSAKAVAPAERGAKSLPRAAWPRMVLARVYRSINPPRLDDATRVMEEAVRLAPGDPRVLGEMVVHLRSIPGDTEEKLYQVRQKLAAAAPRNLVAQMDWAQAQAARGEHAGALSSLNSALSLLPRLPRELEAAAEAARSALQQGRERADRELTQLSNLMKGEFKQKGLPYWDEAQNRIYGNGQDPADLVQRDWLQPAPRPAAPPLPEVSITWTDVTKDAGLDTVRASGEAPAAVGDLDLARDLPQATGGDPQIQQAPDLALPGLLLLNRGGKFEKQELPAGAGSCLAVDLNNDYALDLYVAGAGKDQLFKNRRSVSLDEATNKVRISPAGGPLMAAGALAGQGRGAGAPLAVDLDQDGDLDIVRPSADPRQPILRYLRNNGSFKFTDLTKSSGLGELSRGARQATFADWDGDGDPDLLAVQEAGPPRLFFNRRQDLFTPAGPEWGVPEISGSLSAASADFNRDRRWDLVLCGEKGFGTKLLLNRQNSSFEEGQLPDARDARWVEAVDWDNDTWIDLVFATSEGIRLYRNQEGRFTAAGSDLEGDFRWVTPLDYDLDGDHDLLAATASGELKLLRNEGGNQRPWMRAEMRGLTRPAEQAVNVYGIGNIIETQTLYDQQPVLVRSPLTLLGLGRARKAIAMRVTWTNGVPDDAIAPPAEATTHYVQTPRGSCPFLYTWDGEKYRFACDFNWRSPLGMTAGRGRSVPHDQTGDWVRLPDRALKPSSGFYRLIATEELREISYFDQLRLAAVDHPAGTAVYLDERFPFGPALPFRLYTTRSEKLPRSATDETGRDLLPQLRSVDQQYTPVPETQGYRGILKPHDLILDLGRIEDPGRVLLFLNGWIYPASPSGNLGASQNRKIRIIPPTLSVGDGRGGWRTIDRGVGLPCGKRKTIVLDLSGRIDPADPRVRLTTTMEIRWDAAFWTSGEEPVKLRMSDLRLAEAELRPGRVGTRFRESEDGPDLFDYNRPASQPAWRPIRGRYTRWGDCSELLREVDDRSVVMGPAEELALLFDGRALPPVAPGQRRTFIFLSDGWTKDTDPNTLEGETVEPLPFHGMRSYPPRAGDRPANREAFERYRNVWNTRRVK